MRNNSSGGGVGIATVVFIVFLILKLTGTISISWWLVFLPLVIGCLFWLVIFIFLFIATKSK